MHILSLILWVPFFGALLIALLPATQHRLIRGLALFHASLTLLLSWGLLVPFDRTTAAIQFTEQVVWSSTIGVSYALGVDGLSLPMVLLATLLSAVALLASNRVTVGVKGYHVWLLILEFAILGVFMARDWSLFFMFWELTLIPLFFLIDLWGGEKRHVASLNFVLYTMGGSIFILIGLIVVYRLTPTQSFSMVAIAEAAVEPAPSGTGLAVAGLSHRLRRENPCFPAAWLAAAGSCRGAQPGQHPAVRRVAEDGRLWLAAGGGDVAGSDAGVATVAGRHRAG